VPVTFFWVVGAGVLPFKKNSPILAFCVKRVEGGPIWRIPELLTLPLGAVACHTEPTQNQQEPFSFPSVPVVIGIDGQPVDVTADHDAGFLFTLLGAVVAGLA
jgi:hypothetical protein